MSSIAEQLAARRAVAQKVSEIYETALGCAELCAVAGIPVPEEIGRLLGNLSKEEKANGLGYPNGKRTLPSLPSPFPDLPDGWIAVPAVDAHLTTFVRLAVGQGATTLRKIVAYGTSIHRAALRENSLYATLKRLRDARIVQMDHGRLDLVNPELHLELRDGNVVGPHDLFQPLDLATHRRHAEVLAIKANGPMLRSEMMAVLQQAPWVHAPIGDSLIKNDMEVLSAANVVRRATTSARNEFRWELVPETAETPKAVATVHRIGVASR